MIDCPSCDGSGYDPREVALFTPVACRHCDGVGRVHPAAPTGLGLRYVFAGLVALSLVVGVVGWARAVDERPIERVYDHDCSDGAYLVTAVCGRDDR